VLYESQSPAVIAVSRFRVICDVRSLSLFGSAIRSGCFTNPDQCIADHAKQADANQANVNQTSEPQDSHIAIENWVKPKSGWLYVLDPKPEAKKPGGRIWLVDPETGKVTGSIRTGDNPDFALSPDGSRLYIASITEGDSSELAAIDTTQGVVLQRGEIENREAGDVLPSFSTMAVSADGSALRILLDTPKSADADSFLFATFNTQTGEFLPKAVHLGNCGPGRFISYPAADLFDVLCPRTNRIRFRVDADSRELQNWTSYFRGKGESALRRLLNLPRLKK
jgi:hypothetical protein